MAPRSRRLPAAPTPAERFELLAAALSSAGASRRVVFGRPCLVADGTAFACLDGADLALRVPVASPEWAARTAALPVRPFDPFGRGRPMPGWAVVTDPERWEELARLALETHVS